MRTGAMVVVWMTGCGATEHSGERAPATDADRDGYAADDCDDADGAVHPGATEQCDGIDNDCDGTADGPDAVDAAEYWGDADDDGFGAGASTVGCAPSSGAASNGGDCDDSRADVNPDAAEVCDDLDTDEDCDSLADDDDDSTDETTKSHFYTDSDGDGFGQDGTDVAYCDAGAGHTAVGGDCDDAAESAHPGAPEVCGDLVDNDCDAATNCAWEGEAATSSADALLVSDESVETCFGVDLAGAGDVDGDGVGDLLVGTTSEHAYLFLGPVTSTATDDAAAALSGVGVDDHHGWVVRGIEDQAGDGYADIAVSAFDWSHYTGRVYLMSGPLTGAMTSDSVASTTISGVAEDDFFGWGSSSGDVDGDGIDDVVISAPWSRGHLGDIFVFLGPLPPDDLTTDDGKVTISGGVKEAFPGGRLSAAGDLDGDGIHELVFVMENEGTVGLVRGPVDTNLATEDSDMWMPRPAGASWYPSDVQAAPAGDLDDDGFDDLTITAQLVGKPGVAWIVSGPTATATSMLDPTKDAMTTIAGKDIADLFGEEVDTDGDFDADGADDVVVGAPYYDKGAGAAFVYYGPVSGGVLTEDDAGFRILGESDEYAGSFVRYTGDLDGDGATELAVSSRPGEYTYWGTGVVTLWYGGVL